MVLCLCVLKPRKWPGQLVEIPVRILDQYQNPTYAILRLTDVKANSRIQTSPGGAAQEDDVSIVNAPEVGTVVRASVCFASLDVFQIPQWSSLF